MKRTISAMRGKGSLSHNSRQFIAENVDSSRTPLNVEYCNEDIRAVYHELFDGALARYNEKQTRKDLVIDDYYEKIRTGKQEKPFEELIIQIGNKDDMNASSENGQLARQMLDEYMQSFHSSVTRRCACSLLTCTWMKPRRIFILISFRSQPAVSADSKPACRSKRRWKHSALRAAQKVTLS